MKSDHPVFASNFEMIQSYLDKKCSCYMYASLNIFVWMMIKIQWLLLILNGNTKPYFVYMKMFILFVLFS